MRISDWSSDVCSSDLVERVHAHRAARFDLGRLRFDQLHDMADHVGVGDMVVGDPREEDHMLAVASAGDADVGLARFAGAVDDAAQYRERHRGLDVAERSEEHTSELQSLMRISYAVF